jgi:fibronectin-binding autotransporter adhesin
LPSVSSPPGNFLTVGGGDKSGSFEGLLTAPIPGLQRLVKIGTGTQSLTGTSSDFSGGIRIFGGVLEAAFIGFRSQSSSIGRAPTGADGLIIDGGTFRHTGTDSVTDRGFTIGPLGGTIEASGNGKLDFQNYTGIGDPIALSGITTPRTLTLGGTSTAENRIHLVIPDKGTGSAAAATTVVKTGSGTWILSADNSFTGQLLIFGGTLSIPESSDYSVTQPMGIGAASSTKLILDGGCLAMTAATNQAWNSGFRVGQNGGCINVVQPNVNFVWSSNRTAFHLDGTLEKRGPGLLRLSSSTSVGHTAMAETDLRVHEGTVQFTSGVSGSPYGLRAIRAEVKSGGAIRLSSNNTLGGNSSGTTGSWGTIQLDGGTLEVNGSHFLPPAAPGASPSLILAAGQVTGTQTLSATTSGALISSLASSSSSIIGNSGLSTALGPITFDVADGDAAFDLVINAPVTGTGQVGLIKSGSGTLSLAATNTYAGSTRVDSGTLELATSGTLRLARSATGEFNRVHGGGNAIFRGAFDIVTDTTNLIPGSRWRLVETATATYSPEFSIPGFTRQGTIHTRNANGLLWSFDEESGELSLTFAQIPPDFASWANLISDANLRGAQDDPDGDGLTNHSEYLFGSMPHIPDGAVLLTDHDGAQLVLRWLQIQSGASYQLQQGSLDANTNWELCREPAAPDPVQAEVPPGWTRMRAVILVDQTQQFFRIQGAIP